MTIYIRRFACILSILCTTCVHAATQEVRIEGRKSVTVTTPIVTVADIANVSSLVAGNDEAIIALKKIKVAEAPKPGGKSTLTASTVLQALRANGVDVNAIGYHLPRVISVQRAGRKVLEQELRAVIENLLKQTKRDIAVRSIDFDRDLSVAPGEVEMSASLFETQKKGTMGFTFEVEAEDTEKQHFEVEAEVEEWRDIPVASRSIQRGSVIDVGDIKMARFNVSSLPGDVALDPKAVYGFEANKNISFGEVFQKRKLAIPPVIEMGATVTLLYSTGVLEATASGVAIESGALGDDIKVRNDSSKKIILGKILEPGVVGVNK